MTNIIGLDIGGTKIAGGVFAPDGAKLAGQIVPTPQDYASFLAACHDIVRTLESETGKTCPVGIGIAGRITPEGELGDASPNMPFLKNKPLRQDLKTNLSRDIRLANDANCVALAEATDGAGQGCDSVFALTLGTGIGGGFVMNARSKSTRPISNRPKFVLTGANGLAAEIGHLPLPFREESDGPIVACGCKQKGCIEQSISGPALTRLCAAMTGKESTPEQIAEKAKAADSESLRVLDRYFEVLAKAMVAVIHAFDPAIIVCAGSLSALPGLYEDPPKRWSRYAYTAQLKTKLAPAKHGPLSGMRGAARLFDESE